jgi:hypothetical protein
VIKNPEDAIRVYQGKKEQIDTIKEGSIKLHEEHPADSKNNEEIIPAPVQKPKTHQRRIVEPESR